jgi:hypothetical protein
VRLRRKGKAEEMGFESVEINVRRKSGRKNRSELRLV